MRNPFFSTLFLGKQVENTTASQMFSIKVHTAAKGKWPKNKVWTGGMFGLNVTKTFEP